MSYVGYPRNNSNNTICSFTQCFLSIIFLYNFSFSYVIMSKVLSTKYYKKKKMPSKNIVVKDPKISQKMKNKS